MKVKNIVFSGVMAAILGATGAHAAEGDQIQLISKTYADNNLQAKLTQANNAGDNVTISADGKIGVNLTNYATTSAVDTAISNAVTSDTGVIKTVIDDVKADVDALDGKVGELPTSGDYAAATIVEYINKKTTGIATNAALGELQGDVDALESKVGNDTVANQITAAIASEVSRSNGAYAAKSLEGIVTSQGEKITTLEAQFGETGATTQAIAAAKAAAEAAQADVDAVEKSLADNNTIAKANAAAVKTEVQSALDLKADASALNNYRTSADQDGIDDAIKASITDITKDNGVIDTKVGKLETALDARLDTLEAIDHSTFATKQEITDAKYVSGVGQAAGQYLINFDANGNATYTAITIVE